MVTLTRATGISAPSPRAIDYERMKREFPKQKAALTRAVKSGSHEKVFATIRKTVAVWDEIGAWPDDWAHWQRALHDLPGCMWLSFDDVAYGHVTVTDDTDE